MKYILDFDETISKMDVGRDCISPDIGLDGKYFMEKVREIRKNIRETPEYNAEFEKKYGVPHEYSIELAAVLIEMGIHSDVVRENGRQSKNNIRDGFFPFKEYANSVGDEIIVLSACPAEWLRYYWEKYGNGLEIIGTELSTDENGVYNFIKQPCGEDGKPILIKPYLNGDLMVGVGDSLGDRGFFDELKKREQLTIGIGIILKGI